MMNTETENSIFLSHAAAVHQMLLKGESQTRDLLFIGGARLHTLEDRIGIAQMVQLNDADVLHFGFEHTANGYELTELSACMRRDETNERNQLKHSRRQSPASKISAGCLRCGSVLKPGTSLRRCVARQWGCPPGRVLVAGRTLLSVRRPWVRSGAARNTKGWMDLSRQMRGAAGVGQSKPIGLP